MGTCILHRDYHRLRDECYATAIQWMLDRHDIPYERRYELYQQEVEFQMLNDLWTVGK